MDGSWRPAIVRTRRAAGDSGRLPPQSCFQHGPQAAALSPHIGGVPGTAPLSQIPQPQSKGAEAPLTICAGGAGVRLHQSQRDTTRALTSPLRVCPLGQEGPGGHCSGGEGLHKAGVPRPVPSRESDSLGVHYKHSEGSRHANAYTFPARPPRPRQLRGPWPGLVDRTPGSLRATVRVALGPQFSEGCREKTDEALP